jgi:hypothetical protein
VHKREANNLRCETFAGCFEKHLKAGIQKKTFGNLFRKNILENIVERTNGAE